MGYAVVWASAAEEDIDRIGRQYPISASIILDQIDRLATDPVGLSRPASFPHQDGQKYQFWVDTENGRMFVTVLFFYLPGETTIQIHGIGVTIA